MSKSRNTILTAAGPALCALGVVLPIATGATGYPEVPPGAVITAVGALLVAFAPWRFIPVAGFVIGAFITFGAFVTPNTGDRLRDPGSFGPLFGTLVQILGPAMSVIFGALAVVEAFRGDHRSVGANRGS